MVNSLSTLTPNSNALSLHSDCDKPFGLGFNIMEQIIPNHLNFSLENLPNEIWHNLSKLGDGLNNKISISTLGRLKSIKREVKNSMGGVRLIKERILRQFDNKKGGGYLIANIHDGNKTRLFQMHRLIAKEFIPNPYNYKEVNHKDFNPKNNSTDNLEWVSHKQNVQHYLDDLYKRMNNGEKVSNYRFTKDEVIDIFTTTLKYREISEKYNVNWITIKNIKLGYAYKEITKDLPQNTKRRTKLSVDTVLDIYNNRNLPFKLMMDKYSLSQGAVIAVRTGRTHSKITKHKR